jgi:DnaJ-class molecular chaperone
MSEKVSIVCHCCDGWGFIEELHYPSKEPILTACPECNGKGYVLAKPVNVEIMARAKTWTPHTLKVFCNKRDTKENGQ